MATPSGKVQCQPKNVKDADAVFCADEDQQQDQGQEPDSQRGPQGARAGELDRRFHGCHNDVGFRGRARRVRRVAAHVSIFAPSATERNRQRENLAAPASGQQRAADSGVNVSGMGMLRRLRSATVRAAVWFATVCLLAACSNSDPLGPETRDVKSIVVGSGDSQI